LLVNITESSFRETSNIDYFHLLDKDVL
jgi:hypothetical protein